MKKFIIPGLLAGVVLLVLSYVMLHALPLFPRLAEEYYNAVTFRSSSSDAIFYYIHPFIFGLAMAWFWDRFKDLFTGNFMIRGLEVGLVYAVIAMLPTMWITFSALNVSLMLVGAWFLYGVLQAVIAGEICARMNP